MQRIKAFRNLRRIHTDVPFGQVIYWVQKAPAAKRNRRWFSVWLSRVWR